MNYSKWQNDCITEMLNEASEREAERVRTPEQSLNYRLTRLASDARGGDTYALNGLYDAMKNGFITEHDYASVRLDYNLSNGTLGK